MIYQIKHGFKKRVWKEEIGGWNWEISKDDFETSSKKLDLTHNTKQKANKAANEAIKIALENNYKV